MTLYEKLLSEADNLHLITKEQPLQANTGRIKGNRIAIKKDISSTEKACVMAEELGHYYTTSGDILQQHTISDQKQEYRARFWSYDKLIGLTGIIRAFQSGCRNRYEVADYLGVTELFLKEALDAYRKKYGEYKAVDNYVIYFEPSLAVLEWIN